MKGMFLYMRGFGKDFKRSFIRDQIAEKKLEFIGLLETMKSDFSPNELHNLCGGRNFIWNWSPPRGRSGGILVGVSGDNFFVEQTEIREYFVRVLIFDKK